MLGFLPGMSLRDAAQREIDYGQSTSDRSGTENYNWQDRFGGFLGGYTREDVEKEMQRKQDKKLLETLEGDYGDTGTRLGVLDSSYKGTLEGIKGKTAAQLRAAQSSDKRLAGLLETYAGIDNANISGINPNIKSPGLQQLITSQLASNKTAKETKAETKADKLLAMQLGISNQQYALQNKRADLMDLRDQRQQEYNNRVLDQRDAQAMRNARDKQFAMILAGLNNVGQIFA